MGIYIVKSVQEMIVPSFRGCPKRKICGLNQAKSKTCLSGPYTYCGKYRSIVESRRKE